MAGRKRTFEETEEQGTSASAPRRGRGRPRLVSRTPDTARATPATSSTPATRRTVKAAAARRATTLDHTVGEEGGHDSDDSGAEDAEDVGNAEDMDAGPEEFIAAVENMEVNLPRHITSHKADIDGDIERLSAPTTNFQGNTVETYRREILRWKVCIQPDVASAAVK